MFMSGEFNPLPVLFVLFFVENIVFIFIFNNLGSRILDKTYTVAKLVQSITMLLHHRF